MLNKSLPSRDADDSQVLHLRDGISAGIVYFGSRKLDGLSRQRSNKQRFKKTEANKTGDG
jgi:hypothetical protein